ncbi:hypothetical protein GOODEAATRI_012495 [Goodea atripinnis]|uniref:Uncharacterized protein n=1 Tax=Goodea atripinnis TaxID=208336 RepID=A0ABV0MHC1_9TELE
MNKKTKLKHDQENNKNMIQNLSRIIIIIIRRRRTQKHPQIMTTTCKMNMARANLLISVISEVIVIRSEVGSQYEEEEFRIFKVLIIQKREKQKTTLEST